jgi:hypothetical protein
MKHLLLNSSSTALAALLALAVVSCDRNQVKVYHVETNEIAAATPPPMAASAAPAAMPGQMPMTMPAGLAAPDKSALPQLKYTAPAGWTEKPASSMRVASFGVSAEGKTADISVIPLGGMAGGAAANVTRWRGQIGLPPVTDDEAAKLAEKVSVGDQPAELYDLDGGAQRILAVSFRRDDTSWFFKMTGDAALVEAQKPAFVSFLKTVQFGASAK